MNGVTAPLLKTYYAIIPITGVASILSVPLYLGFAVVGEEVVSLMLGLTIAATFLKYPYRERAGALEIALGVLAIATWCWSAWNYEAWIVGMADRTPDKWVPGVFAVVLMMEALRKACGNAITTLAWILIVYAFFGHLLPGALEAQQHAPTKIILYNYADSNGIPGLVLRIVCTLVLAFIIFGRLMEVSGATKFLTDTAMAWMGHRRGGPAKVAVVASSAFGMVSGSTVGNIMSTGIVTIPLMKESGFRPQYAAAIEAVASNGGQIAPPVMGATAFLIAEFLQISYAEVVLAAIIPAVLYYLVLFLQVDAIAAKFGLQGLPRDKLPKLVPVLLAGWVYILPVAVLIFLLFWRGYRPALAAMYAVGALLLLYVVMSLIKDRRLPGREKWSSFVLGSGENLLPLIMIGGGAGVIIGVLNSTGLGFQLALILAHVGESAGLLVMLILTALICIILGMGMPTAAVYLVLAIVLAPALEEMGVVPIAAHLFLFYFGLLSLLTPPVAVASYVAAGLAGSNMWATGLIGVQLAAAAYLFPFLWVFNPALVFEGSTPAVIYAFVTAAAACWLLARAIQAFGGGRSGNALACLLFGGALAIGTATIWIGPESPLTLIPAALGAVVILWLRRAKFPVRQPSPAE